MSTATKVRHIIVDHLCVEPAVVVDSAEIMGAALDADSLEAIELVMAIEEEFGLEISDEDAERLKTVGDVIAYVEKRAAVKS